jgi:hypothetical protein
MVAEVLLWLLRPSSFLFSVFFSRRGLFLGPKE